MIDKLINEGYFRYNDELCYDNENVVWVSTFKKGSEMFVFEINKPSDIHLYFDGKITKQELNDRHTYKQIEI